MARFAVLRNTALLCVAVGCAAERKLDFQISGVNTGEQELRCVIYLQEEIQRYPDGREILTPTKLQLKFEPTPDGSPESIRMRVRAVDVDPSGKVTRGLLPGEQSDYREDSRDIYPTDARRQLFILPRRPAGG